MNTPRILEPGQQLSSNALTNFRECLKRYTRQAVCGRDYVLTDRFKRDCLKESDIQVLLNFIYRDKVGSPTTASTIRNHSSVVFMTLLASELDGLGRLLLDFLEQQIHDGKLPIDRDTLLRKVQTETIKSDRAAEIADRFCQTQWQFCAYCFGDRESVTIQDEYILPILEMKPINEKGGTASLYEIVVLEDFVSEGLRKNVDKAAFISNQDQDGRRYTFALKTFKSASQPVYQTEKEAFDGLRNHSGIVKCLLCYKHCNSRWPKRRQETEIGSEATHNILLEFGEHDLEEYFHDNEPPVLQEEIENFWQDLFAVAKALNGLHNFQSPTANALFAGWHADIKPDNILFIHGEFKLADPGFARFEPVQVGTEPQRTKLRGGTWTYGAPERLTDNHKGSVTQAIDIWSLGCVLSEAVTWLVGGSSGIRAYTDIRKAAVVRANLPKSYIKDLKSGDCFHDSTKVLPDVLEWHKLLRNSIRRNDHVTEKVLDLVEKKMLLENPSERITALQLVSELTKIEQAARACDRCNIPESIQRALLRADESGTKIPALSLEDQQKLRPDSKLNRIQRKSLLLGTPLKKTAQRSEHLKSALASSETIKGQKRESIDLALKLNTNVQANGKSSPDRKVPHPITPPPSSSRNPARPSASISQHSKHNSLASITSPMASHSLSAKSSRVDVFKARKELRLGRTRLTDRVKKFTGRDRRNVVLSQHFDDRDIIFLVDNAASMQPYWEQAEFLLTTLVDMCRGQDENGMDLLFTAGNEELRGRHNPSDFGERMYKPNAMPSHGYKTDICDSLGKIFKRHMASLRHRSISTKLLTIIVLTDGLWQGMPDQEMIKHRIADFVRDVGKIDTRMRTRPVSIQFIQFGRDLSATLRLKSLDDDMAAEYQIPDVIDHEYADGDVYKMILGSFVWDFDRRETESIASPPLRADDSFSSQRSLVESPQAETPLANGPAQLDFNGGRGAPHTAPY